MQKLLMCWRKLSLGQEIAILIVVKLIIIILIWRLFFYGRRVEVLPQNVLDAPALQTDFHHEETINGRD